MMVNRWAIDYTMSPGLSNDMDFWPFFGEYVTEGLSCVVGYDGLNSNCNMALWYILLYCASLFVEQLTLASLMKYK
jgi:hypothetical protein